MRTEASPLRAAYARIEAAGLGYVAVGAAFTLVSLVPSALAPLLRLVVPEVLAPERATGLFVAICGGLTAGLGATLWQLGRALRRDDAGPAAVLRAARLGLTVWYLVDTAGSLAHRSWQNAVGNTLFFALAVGPLALALRALAAREPGADATARSARAPVPA